MHASISYRPMHSLSGASTVQDQAILRCSNCFAYVNPYCEVRSRWCTRRLKTFLFSYRTILTWARPHGVFSRVRPQVELQSMWLPE